MENKGEDVISEVLAKARAEEAERQRKNPDSVIYFRNSLMNDNIRLAFDILFNPDSSLTEEGKKYYTNFCKLIPQIDFSGSKSYFIKGDNQLNLYKFLCLFIKAEWKYRVLVKQRNLKQKGKDFTFKKVCKEVHNLMPIVIFASVFVDYVTHTGDDSEILGDSYSKLLVIYIPNVTLFGNQLPFYASTIKNYIRMKNSKKEHVIVLSEVNLLDFTNDGSLTLIDLSENKVKEQVTKALVTNSTGELGDRP